MFVKYLKPMISLRESLRQEVVLSKEQEDQITRVVKRYLRMRRNKVIRKFIKIK